MYLLTFITLSLCISQSNASSDLKMGPGVSYDVLTPSPKGQVNLVPYSATMSSPLSESETIEVAWENSTTSSIAVSWRFAKSYKSNGTVLGTRVEYFLTHGKFRSHMLPPSVNVFVFESLKVATTYKLCVTTFENVNEGPTSDTIDHTKCFKLRTIPYIRRDSVLILLLTLSYFLFMGFMGYSQWRRHAAAIRNRVRRSSTNSSEPTTPVLRWREVEERQRLCFPSSIEEPPRNL